jgi:hypothetical protein
MFMKNWTMDENGVKLRVREVKKVDLEEEIEGQKKLV